MRPHRGAYPAPPHAGARAGRKIHPVVAARSMLVERREMHRRRIALVAVKAEMRLLAMHDRAHAVARHLGDDRCRRDRRDLPSPPTIASPLQGRSLGSLLPSISTWSAVTPSPSTACRIAHNVAWRMLSRSMTSGGATTIDTVADSHDRVVQRLALQRRQLLGIVEPVGHAPRLSTTADTTTGPASGPRPASSTPHTTVAPRRSAARSKLRSGPVRAMGESSGMPQA